MICAFQIPDLVVNEMLSTTFVLGLILCFVFQCLKTMWKRREIRRELLWSKHNQIRTGIFRPRTDEDTLENSEGDLDFRFLMGQTGTDIRNAHSLCGCYRSDRSRPDHQSRNLCSSIFECFTATCCGLICKCHCQVCGVCAVAQEGRELERLIPSKYRRLDYVTMQSQLEYYPSIYEHRHGESGRDRRIFGFWFRLSDFSKWVMGVLLAVLLVLMIWSLLGVHRHFQFQNYVVFCATLLQAYFILKIVHWRHEADISTDALIKFFMSGFCLSTTMAVFFEVLIGLTVRLVMTLIMLLSGIDEVKSGGYTSSSPGFANGFTMDLSGDPSSYRDYLEVYGKDHPIVYTIYLAVAAFGLAATTEELCKYFGFRMVEHPDFLSEHELVEAVQVAQRGADGVGRQFPDFSKQNRTAESRGASITIAMIATALGFACCENLVYIFVYGGSSVDVEVFILIARTIFPVHPIAAALQSIRVCQRDVEKKDTVKTGNLILPGLLFHGIYDFTLLWIDYLATRKANYVDGDDETVSPDVSNLVSFASSIGVLIGGLLYYWWVSKQQRSRLQAMDNQ
eukprot:Nitzschia sp. Nitz4//scaffold1_size375055//370667//372364//NITZ4_000347-RA/size375055-processed-gene-0.94-mRNA-1//1//CDS//3329541258//313//frame0